eukprot:scaffold11269_cov59-Cylindrotheca_fusiformis.AAC.1
MVRGCYGKLGHGICMEVAVGDRMGMLVCLIAYLRSRKTTLLVPNSKLRTSTPPRWNDKWNNSILKIMRAQYSVSKKQI